jgi:hypothetical protein
LEDLMLQFRLLTRLAVIATAASLANVSANAQEIKKVFVIAMENHNWTQPANQFTGGIQQIFQNPNAPFINSLVNGTASALINGTTVNISQQVSYATAYHKCWQLPADTTPTFIRPSPTIFGRKLATISAC